MDTNRGAALAVLATGMLMTVLDGSIVTVAMPVIQADLGFTPSGLTWVVNAYLIAFGSLLLLAGRLGDLLGRKPDAPRRHRRLHRSRPCSPASPPARRCSSRPASCRAPAAPCPPPSASASSSPCSPPRPNAPRRSASSRSPAPPAPPSARSSAASSPTCSAGTGSSSSTCRSASPRSLAMRFVPGGPGPRPRAPGADVLGAVLVTAGLMLGIYTVVRSSSTAGSPCTPRPRRACRWPCWPASSPGRPPPGPR